MSRAVSTPIIIFSFARPEYLARLCASLKAQERVTIPQHQIYLLQDGAVSPRSGVRYTDDALIEQCIATFREAFPDGQVVAAPHNLGLALNILRGEQLVFEQLGRDVGYFFEDDLELGPLYLHAMEEMRVRTEKMPEVGYFAAYGNFHLGATGPRVTTIPLEHHWGFGLWKRCWTAITPWLRDFNKIIHEIDYRARPHLRIVKLYRDKRVANNASSQDVAKTLACADLGFVRINTDVCFAKYIGATGESFGPEKFARAGFDRMDFVGDGDFVFDAITPEVLRPIYETQLRRYTDFRTNEYDAYIAEYATRVFDPDVPVTREEVDDVWRLVMDRLPDGGEEFYEKTVGKITLRTLRSRLMKSREGRSKSLLLLK